MVKGFVRGLIVFLLAAIFFVQGVYAEPAANSQQATGYTLEFPSSRYPETGAHIRDAIATGHSAVCTIDRDGAEENRKESLKG
ncbi:Sporulation-specific extracellular nuclease [Paenibacillus sp. S25]|nr:Sporulation-specific extracellular nuclease [Paenibacillus sp. S25]